MVAVFTGNALGLFDTSYAATGGGLSGGAGRDLHGVNAATGNLVLQGLDELLTYRGMTVAATRAYNSLGIADGRTGTDAWRTGLETSVKLLSGTAGQAGSTVQLTTADLDDVTYLWDAGRSLYVATEGAGAHDTLAWVSGTSTWVREDGNTLRQEHFKLRPGDGTNYYLAEIRETRHDGTDPARFEIRYDDGANPLRITELRSFRNGDNDTGNDAILFGYDGSGRLNSISTREGGQPARQQTVYEYDGQGRLITVQHDLTPDTDLGDNTWNVTATANDGQRFRTQYTYEGTTLRIASVKSSDGVLSSYTYDGSGRVLTVTRGDTNTNDGDGIGETTTFVYFGDHTDVTDSLGRTWSYYHSAGRLLQLHGPARDGLRDVTTYAYDTDNVANAGDGNVTEVVTTRGGVLVARKDFEYDANGNVIKEWDALGNAVFRTWTAKNQLATQTAYTGVDPDIRGAAAPTGGLTTTFVYDAQNRLRFTVGPMGEVTQLRYGNATAGDPLGSYGQVVESRRYLSAAYASTLTETALNTWATNATQANASSLTTYAYDANGRLVSTVEYAGSAGDAPAAVLANTFTNYVYDPQGLLRQKLVRHGADHTAGYTGDSEVVDYVYDGIGRLLDVISRGSSVPYTPDVTSVASLPDATTLVTRTTYIDSSMRVSVVTDGGVTRLETRNAEGRLLNVSEAATGQTTRNTYHHYDNAGQLRATEDAGGGRTYFFYDERGNLAGTVDPTGSVVEKEYDSLGRAIRTLTHSERVNTTAWMSGSGASATFTAYFPQRAASQNGWGEDFADSTIVGLDTTYINNPTYTSIKRVNGQLVLQRTNHTTNFFPNAMSPGYAVADGPMFRAEVSTDASLTNLYGFFGFWNGIAPGQIGLLFQSGKISAYDYGGGTTDLLTLTANTTYVIELHATTEGIDLRVTVKGQDASNGTAFHIDTDPSLWPSVCFNIQSNMYPGASSAALYVDNVSHVRVRAATNTYDQAGRLLREFDGNATKTYEYDGAHRLLRTTLSAPGEASRVSRNFYDASNHLIATLDAEGFLTDFTYDVGGRLIQTKRYANVTTDTLRANGLLTDLRTSVGTHATDQVTRNLYDRRDRQIGVLDAEGYLTEYIYDDANNQRATRAYAKKLSPGSAASLASLVSSAMTSPPAEPFRETRRTFNGLGQLAKEVNHEGTVTAYTYDHAGRLVRTEVAQGTAEVREGLQWFDAFGQLVGEISGQNIIDGGITPAAFEGLTEAQKVTFATTWGTRHSYDVLGRRIESVDAQGHKTWFIYDAAGRNTFTIRGALNGATKNAKGEVTETRYTAFGEVAETLAYTGAITIGSPYGHAQAWAAVNALAYVAAVDSRRLYYYDSRGLMVQQIDTESGATVHRYNGYGELASSTAPISSSSSTTTTRAYDRRGLQTSQVEAAGTAVARTTSQVYDAFGRVTSAVDGRGIATTFAYDRIGRQVVSTSRATYTGISGQARTETTSATYDAFSRVLTQTNGVGQVTSYAYSDVNRTVTVTTPDGLVVATARSRHGETLTVTAPGGAITSYAYDKSGRQVQVTAPDGDIQTFTYDARDLLVASVENTNGNRVEYTYDAAGRVLTRKEDAGSGRLNLTTTYAYDAQGRTVSVTDPSTKVTTTAYDRQGRVVTVTRDPAGLNIRTQYAWDAAGNQLSVTEGYGTVEARTVAYTYDELGRRTHETVAPGTLNFTTRYVYDAADNVVARVNANGVGHGYVYDQANRLIYSLDVMNPGSPTPILAVTRNWYDEAGRVTATRRYANTITLTQLEDAELLSATGGATLATLDAKLAAVRDDNCDELNYSVYDAGGRLRFKLAMGDATKAFVSEVRYDTRGNASHQLAYPTAVTLTSTYLANFLLQGDVSPTAAATRLTEAAGLVASQAATAPQSYTVFDAAGNEKFVVSMNDAGLGVVVEKQYDLGGEVVTTIRHARAITFNPAADVAATYTALAGETADQMLVTRYAYDRLGRLRFTVGDTGVVTEQIYDALSRVVETREYMVAMAPSAWTESAIATAVAIPANQVGMRKTVNQYDAASRLTRVTDALGKYEGFGYDAVGNRISYTDKLLKTWNYVYDAGGRLIEEKAPAVAVTRFTAATGTAQTSTSLRIATRMTYDALGNVLTRTENADAVDVNERRTTTYVYDSRGNQIRTTFPDAWRIDDTSLALVATGVQPFVEITYDALGRAVVQKDVLGNYSYKVYDRLGQVGYEIDAAGYVTSYEYDARGRQTKLTRHATALAANVPAGRDTGAVLALATWKTAITPLSTGNRVLVTTYDRLGQKKTVQQAAAAIGYYDSTGALQSGIPTTEYAHDNFGQLVCESVLVEGTKWARTWHYYDQVGQRTLSVDPAGYVTTWAYDASGREVSRREYARALAPAVVTALTAGTPPTVPVAGDAATGLDRVVLTGYDDLGRKTSETLSRQYQDPTTGVSAFRNVVTGYTYDAEDRVTVTTVDGQATTTTYDDLGRATSVTEAARNVLKAVRSGQAGWAAQLNGITADLGDADLYESVSPYTVLQYDAFGNAVRTVRYANGRLGGAAPVGDGTNDQNNFVRYDYQGRAVASTDATGHTVYTQYTAADKASVTFYDLADGQGGTARIKDLYSYDKLGRQIEHYECHWVGYDHADGAEAVVYNAFGEITTKAWIPAHWSDASKAIEYTYDAVGNLVGNDEAGAIRSYRYNLAGQQVGEVRGSAVTRMVLDMLGRATTTVLPSHTSDALLTTTQVQVFDRWGNVLSSTDPRGYVTVRTYNDRNQVLTQVAPSVAVVGENGVSTNVTPQTDWWYDANGRLIGVRDANGKIDRNEYDNVGQLVRSIDALGQSTRFGYDALGRERAKEDALGYVTTQTFDRQNRVVAIGDYLKNAAGDARTAQNRETYVLNGNGDRIKVTNALGQQAKYNFDPRGLMTRSQTAFGVVTQFAYDWSGNKTSETDALGGTQTWLYDIHGRALTHKDLGNNNHAYTYDATGALAQDFSTELGLDRDTTYYTNGLVRKVSLSANEFTEYEYDANGNRTYERNYSLVAQIDKVTRITFDSHNRISRITTDEQFQVAPVRTLDVAYSYDAVGNRRRVLAYSGYGPNVAALPTTPPTSGTNKQDVWFLYDAENRVTLLNGKLVGSQIVVNQNSMAVPSYVAQYDAVGREITKIHDTYAGSSITHQTYTERGQQLYTWYEAPPGVMAGPTKKIYDAAGRLVQELTFFHENQTAPFFDGELIDTISVAGLLHKAVLYTYDADGRVTVQETRGRRHGTLPNGTASWLMGKVSMGDLNVGPEEYYDPAVLTLLDQVLYSSAQGANGYDAAGRLTTYRYLYSVTLWSGAVFQAPDAYTHTYTFTYLARDGYLESVVTGTSSPGSNYKPTNTTSTYDAAGRRSVVEDRTYIPNGVPDPKSKRELSYNAEGQIIARKDTYWDTSSSTWKQGRDEPTPQKLANIAPTLISQAAWDGLAKTGTDAAPGREIWYDRADNHRMTYANGQLVASQTQAGKLDAVSQMTGFSNTSVGTSQAQVQQGDSLKTMAQRIYGNENLWYILADANGLDSGDALTVGSVLNAPQHKTALNDSKTFKPYDPSDITGPTTPSLPFMPPPDAGCGTVGMILMVIVMIVVTVYTAGAAAAAWAPASAGVTAGFGTGLSVLAGTSGLGAIGVGAAATAGLVGSVASQAVGSAAGVASFNWKSALATGAASGITAGLGGTSAFAKLADATNFVKGAVSAVSNNLVSQATSRVFGVDTSFSWKSLAASAISGGITATIAPQIGKAFDRVAGTELGQDAIDFTSGLAGGIVSAHVRRALGVGGKIDYRAIIADAFGNMLANRIGGQHKASAAQAQSEKASAATMRAELEAAAGRVRAHAERDGVDLAGMTGEELSNYIGGNLSALPEDPWAGFESGSALYGPHAYDGLASWGQKLGLPSVPEQLTFGLNQALNPFAKAKMAFGMLTGIIGSVVDDAEAFGGALKGAFEAKLDLELVVVQGVANYFGDTMSSSEADRYQNAMSRTLNRIDSLTYIANNLGTVIMDGIGAEWDEVKADFRMYSQSVANEDYFDAGVATGRLAYKVVPLLLGVGAAVRTGVTLSRMGIKTFDNVLETMAAAAKNARSYLGRRLSFSSVDEFYRATNDPAPDFSYELNGVTWHTDSTGRTSLIEGRVRANPINRNDRELQRLIGHNGHPTDVGFHLWDDAAGGPVSTINVVPGNGRRIADGLSNLNNGEYATLEKQLMDLSANRVVERQVIPRYDAGNVGRRPDSIMVRYRVDGGDWIERPFINKY